MIKNFFLLVFRFFKILKPKEKKKFILLSALNLFASFLELVFISLLIPIFYGITNNNNKFFFIEDFLNNTSIYFKQENNLIFKISFILIFVVFKNTIQLLNQYNVTKFSFSIENTLATRIINNVLNQSLIEDNNSKSTDFIKKTSFDTHRVNIYFSIPLINLITDLFLVIFLLSFIILLEPKISILILTVIGLSLLLFHLSSNHLVVNSGKKLVVAEGKKFEIIKQIFENLSIIRLGNSKSFFIKNFKLINKEYLKQGSFQSIIQQTPKYFYELLLFVSLILIYIIIPSEKLISFLGLFLATMYKLLPSLGRISSSYQSIFFSKESLDQIERSIKKNTKRKFKYKKLISLEFKNVSFNYGGKQILNNASFKIQKNSFLAIKGESGSGKSTLLSLIMKLNNPKSGEIYLNDENYIFNDIKIGYVSQKISLLNTSIIENIAFGQTSHLINKQKILNVIKESELNDFIDNSKDGINTVVGENGAKISGGQIQRIGIARALYCDPDLIIFDESTNSLDNQTKSKIINTLKKISREKTVIYVTHDEEYLKKFDIILELKNGKIKLQ